MKPQRIVLLLMVTALLRWPHVADVQAAAAAPWQTQWERTREAAKREGKVAVVGPVGSASREGLATPFEQKYQIPVEFWSERGAALASRIETERKSGQYLWDVIIVGSTTALDRFVPNGVLDPLESALILPEVVEPKNWRAGAIEFYDKGRQLMAMTPQHRGILFMNPKLANPSEIKSYKDLLDPKWKGKMIIDDPRIAGPGRATFTFFYMHPDLGPDFIRALAKQDALLLRDYIQEVDMVAQGKYPLLVGGWDVPAEQRIKQGAPIEIVDRRQVREGTDVNVSNGALGLFNRAPHPNAAKLYINWLLSKEGQTAFTRAMAYVSGRIDVPTDHVIPWRVPDAAGGLRTDSEAAIRLMETKIRPILTEVFGR